MDKYTLLTALPNVGKTVGTDDLGAYLNTIFSSGIGIAALLAALMLVIGGIQYMSTDAVSGKGEGKERIKAALGGLFLALVAVLLLQTINPQLLNTTLTIEDPQITTTGNTGSTPPGTTGSGGSYVPLAPLPGVTTVTGESGLSSYLNNIFRLGIGIAIALAILMMVIGGIQYLSTDAIGGKSEGRERIVQALWGLLLALAAVLILQTINPQFLDTTLEIEPAGVTTTGGTTNPPPNQTGGGGTTYTPLANLPGLNGAVTVNNLDIYLNTMFRFGIGLAIAFAILMIVIGGIQYMSTDAISGKSEGKERIQAAIGGLLLALVAVLILQNINPKLLSTKLDIQQVNVEGVRTGSTVCVRTAPAGYVPTVGTPGTIPPSDPNYQGTFGSSYQLDGTRTTFYYAGETHSDPDTDNFRSATGVTLRYGDLNTVGSAAVDPSVVPLGSIIAVQYPDGTHYFVAIDVGGGVKGNHIDFFSKTPPGNGNDYQNVGIVPFEGNFRNLSASQKESFFNAQSYGDFNAPDNGPGTPGTGSQVRGDNDILCTSTPGTGGGGGTTPGGTTGGATSYVPLAPLPGLNNNVTFGESGLSSYLNNIFRLGIGIAIALAILMMVIGGIQYLSTDAIGGKSEGRERIVQALWGLLLALAAVLILQTINPQFLDTTLEIEPSAVTTTTGGGTVTNQTGGGNSYTPLAPLPGFEKIDNFKGDNALSAYLNNMFRLGIGLAIAFAILMIVIGGIQYYSTDAVSGKHEGRERITAALWGLLIALLAVIVLQVINPQLLSTRLNIPEVDVEGTPATYTTVNPGQPGYPYQPGDPLYCQPAFVPNGEAAKRILEAAQYAADPAHPLNTCAVGRLGCARAVNEIVGMALGKPINDSDATADLYTSLKSSDRFSLVGNDISQAQPGDIIISPTQEGGNIGHVGIIETPGGGSIISNSSNAQEVRRNFNSQSWTNYYQNQKGLPVYIFRASQTDTSGDLPPSTPAGGGGADC